MDREADPGRPAVAGRAGRAAREETVMAPGLSPPITTASVRIARPASIVIYALFSAVLLAVSRRRLARARRDRRPAVVLATARIRVITARLGLLFGAAGPADVRLRRRVVRRHGPGRESRAQPQPLSADAACSRPARRRRTPGLGPAHDQQ